jgi:hypothetical protein
MLDTGQAETLVASLRERVAGSHGVPAIDPALPLALARARREVGASFALFEREPGFFGRASTSGLVGASVAALARWIGSRTP